MSAEFNPYREWLSIPVNELPANYYRLLGLALYESDPNVIEKAADRQMAFIRTFQTGPYSQQSQQLLNELAQARITLLDKKKKAQYDSQLRAAAYQTPSGAIGEMSSPPPPSAASLTPQPWSNSTAASGFDAPVPLSSGKSAVPPAPNSQNKSETILAFLKKHWISILIGLVAVQFIVCGTGLMTLLLKPSKTEVVQNQAQQAQKEDENAAPSEAQRLAEQYYNQSVELQEKEDYDAALNKINVAVDLQPENELYKAHQQALNRLIKVLGKTKNSSAPTESEAESETEPSVPSAVKTEEDSDLAPPAPVRSADAAPKGNVKPSTKKPISTAEAEARLKAQAEARLIVEQEAKRLENKCQAVIAHDEAVQFQKEGKFTQAAEKMEEAVKLDPENEQYKEEKTQIDNQVKADDAFKESVELEEKEQYAEALVKIEEALELDPNNEDYINEKMDIQTAYYKQYVQHRIEREYPQALAKIDKAIELVPTEEFYKEEKQKTEEIVQKIEDGEEIPEKDPEYGEPEEEPEPPEPEKPRGFEPGKKAGERKTVDVDGVEIAFRWCPPGTFIMGSPTSESGREADEKQHEVELTKGFWIMETEITVGMFKAFVRDTGYKSKGLKPWGISNGKWNQNADYSWLNPGFAQNDSSPVTCISWQDAFAFSKWLGTKIESKTSLPTEAQWEYACRAGSKSAYFWGNALNGDKANCNGNYPCGTTVKGPYLERSTHAGNYNSNPWGISDMHGNVWEWCRDGYSDYPSGKVTDPFTPSNDAKRVFRGGSWSWAAQRCRSAYRASFVAAIRIPNMGGRCVVAPSADVPAVQGDLGSGKNAGKRAVKVINGVEFAFRWCPAGAFTMGSPKSEDGRDNDETQHKVTLTKGFWMLETEVTQKQWKAVMGSNPDCKFKGDNLPVENVSWTDCQEFCKKCAQLGFPVQLPTEAQWEYACRAGTTGAYAGNLDEMAWYGYYSNPKGTSKEATTHPVGTKKPNAWGLYDMHGNVWEWCQDWYAKEYPSGSVTDPTGPSSGSYRVVRGGGWHSDARRCRSANRDYYGPRLPGRLLGFPARKRSIIQTKKFA